MLNGSADLLTINPSEAKASEVLADLTQFIDLVLSESGLIALFKVKPWPDFN